MEDFTTPAQAASEYAKRGWSVIPVHSIDAEGRCSCGATECVSAGKHPRVKWAAAQREAATPTEVDEWWQRWPEANVGIVTGAVSRLVVLDVDPRNDGDETLARLVDRFGASPRTPEVVTGGAGRHFYFAYATEPGRTVPSGPIGPGVDLEADGGLVTAPPSRHVSGNPYRWREQLSPSQIQPGALPAWAYLRAGRVSAGPVHEPGTHISRTTHEQEEFAALWRAVDIDLEPGDRYYLCPFHDDHHPSLHIDSGGCRWYCFGCGEGGGPGALRRHVGRRAGSDAVAAARVAAREPETADVPATWMQWPTLQPGGTQEVVGEGEHQQELEDAAGGRTWHGAAVPLVTARLRREPTNLLDPDAVAVELGGKLVGHLPKLDAPQFADVIEDLESDGSPTTARARLTGGWDRGPQGRGSFGVELDVELPPRRRDAATAFLPPGPPVAVHGEQAHQDLLEKISHGAHAKGIVATLVAQSDERVSVEVAGEAVGILGERSAERCLPLLRALADGGYPATADASVIEGSLKREVYVLLPTAHVASRLIDAT